MRYQGGKAIHAKHIARAISPSGLWWDPFCGGLSVSVALSDTGPGVVSDANIALISLYQAVRDGWDPPRRVTLESWRAAKDLPDTDPLKAFHGIGCSYAGAWFSAPDVRYEKRWHNVQHYWVTEDSAGTARRALLRDVARLVTAACEFRAIDFLDPLIALPDPGIEVVYCDPPYAGTMGYRALGPAAFDTAAFWARCADIASTGRAVYVSEFTGPGPESGVTVEEVWNRASGCMMAGKGSGLDSRARTRGVNVQPRMERLYRVIAGTA